MKSSNLMSKETEMGTLRKVNKEVVENPPAGIAVPNYDRSKVSEGMVHLGVGGFHRAHQALYVEDLLQKGLAKSWGICGVGIMPFDKAMNESLTEQDGLYTLVERDRNEDHARIIGSLKRHVYGYGNPEVVFTAMTSAETKIVSMTATEGGYCINQATGELDENHPSVQNDLTKPTSPQSIFGYLAESLDRRRKAGTAPFTILSCDNLQGNGDITKRVLLDFCGRRDETLRKWIEENVTFPNTMVDRITPATTDTERELVRSKFGLDDKVPVVCESFRQWVVEDHFCNGRPEFEQVGVQFTSNVQPYEKMKIRLLNATHSAMGYLGHLLGYKYIHEVALAPEFGPYLLSLMDEEVTPLVGEIPGVNLSTYKRTVLDRFSNEKIKDQVLRICSDGSGKMPKFILPSIQEQLAQDGPIRKLTLCVASWVRFLNGTDEKGENIPLQDPMGERLSPIAKMAKDSPMEMLKVTDIFGDLGQSKRFVEEFDTLLRMMYARGAAETLAYCMKK